MLLKFIVWPHVEKHFNVQTEIYLQLEIQGQSKTRQEHKHILSKRH
jgi:hypothetical protein